MLARTRRVNGQGALAILCSAEFGLSLASFSSPSCIPGHRSVTAMTWGATVRSENSRASICLLPRSSAIKRLTSTSRFARGFSRFGADAIEFAQRELRRSFAA